MIIFLPKHPQKDDVIRSTDCMTQKQYLRTVEAAGSKNVYSDVFNRSERRYWVTMIDNETGEKTTCEYEID